MDSKVFGELYQTFSSDNKIKIAVATGAILIYFVTLAIYRVTLHPLAEFPGPKIAAITSLYQAYYDVIKGGKYVWRLEELHKQYGPIVRINPNDVHINDPEFIDEVFAGGTKKRDKNKIIVRMFGLPESTVSTLPHDLHRMRRGALNPFFSKQSIRRLEPIIQNVLQNLLGILDDFRKEQKPTPMSLIFKAVTSDIISEYAFGESGNCLGMKNFNEGYFKAIGDQFLMIHAFTHIPWLNPLLQSLPDCVTAWLNPVMASFYKVQDGWEEDVKKVLAAGPSKTDGKQTIFYGLLFGSLPESEKDSKRLRQEAHLIMVAGTDTTATTLASIVYHLIANPNVLRKLKAELEIAMPDPEAPPTIAQVETLPYLNGVVQEGIRINNGVSLRMERISPIEDVTYKNKKGKTYTIPKGTPMSMTAPLVHRDENIFPNSRQFSPERWIETPRLDRYQLAFSKGSRICLGKPLALQELTLITAGIWRKFDAYDGTGLQKGPTLELFETSREDVDMVSDYAVPGYKVGSKGLQLLVR